LRKVIWSQIVPNKLKITEKLYKVLLDRAKICTENSEKDTSFRKNLKVIEEDLHRTYSEMAIFRFGNKLYQPLKNVLLAYSLMRPDLGYVQGMSYVAGSLLLHYGTEFDTFVMFANVMNREDMLFHFYSFDMDKVNTVFHIFMRLMKEKLPKLHEIFLDTGLSCSIFLFEWVVAIYSNIF
jgi:TBC1 domain family member 14